MRRPALQQAVGEPARRRPDVERGEPPGIDAEVSSACASLSPPRDTNGIGPERSRSSASASTRSPALSTGRSPPAPRPPGSARAPSRARAPAPARPAPGRRARAWGPGCARRAVHHDMIAPRQHMDVRETPSLPAVVPIFCEMKRTLPLFAFLSLGAFAFGSSISCDSVEAAFDCSMSAVATVTATTARTTSTLARAAAGQTRRTTPTSRPTPTPAIPASATSPASPRRSTAPAAAAQSSPDPRPPAPPAADLPRRPAQTQVAKRAPLRRMSPRSSLVGRVGDVAQLGERLNRTQEADGSIPFISTKLLSIFLSEVSLKRFRSKRFHSGGAVGRP